MSSFIYKKETSSDFLTETVLREYSYTVKNKEITKEIPEVYIEASFKEEKVSIDFLSLITLEELNSFDLDEEIYFNDYLISNELFLGFNSDYKNISVNDIDIYLTRIDIGYFNLRIEIPNYEIIIDKNIRIEKDEEKMPVGEPAE